MNVQTVAVEIKAFVKENLLALANDRGDLSDNHQIIGHAAMVWDVDDGLCIDHLPLRRDHILVLMLDASVTSEDLEDAGVSQDDDEYSAVIERLRTQHVEQGAVIVKLADGNLYQISDADWPLEAATQLEMALVSD